jgi:hypothetical protein
MSVRPLFRRGPPVVMDPLIYALILCLGALPFFFYEKAPDFLHSDVAFADRASSLLHGSDFDNFVAERVEPPGLPVILALVCATVSCTHNCLIRAMPVFLTLGLLFSYEVIRRQRGRLVAAASCLLIASSPSVFVSASSLLWPSYPYFCISMLVLLLTPKLETLVSRSRRVLAAALLCLLVTAAVMVQSAGIALIGALPVWAALSFLRDSPTAKARLKFLVPIILVALLAESLWLLRGSNPRDWPLPGRGESYFSQLRVKNGNYPEMGLASPKDVVLRVEHNLKQRIQYFGEVLIRLWISPSWPSIGVAGLILLILLGLCSSLMRTDSQLCALYFVGYECIYLLWPWSFETPRFALPVLPLACLYAAEGFLALQQWSHLYSRRIGALFLPLSIVLAFFAAFQGWRAGAGHGFQDKASAVFWLVCAIICARLIWKGTLPPSDRLSWVHRFLGKRYSVPGLTFTPAQLLGASLVACLVATGAAAEISIGRENLASGSARLDNIPEIQAARWIQSHTDSKAIIASRQISLVYHYSRRRVIWFPPITNPKILMQGIREHKIQYLIIVDRNFNYYLPPDPVCFALIQAAYPRAFRLVETKDKLRIYEVLPDFPPLAVTGRIESNRVSHLSRGERIRLLPVT